MSENDILAEYIKEKHPEILTSVDFAVYRLGRACRKLAEDFLEAFKKIDLTELKEMADKLNRKECDQHGET